MDKNDHPGSAALGQPTDEGVVRFSVRFRAVAPPAAHVIAPLLSWRQRLRAAGVVGQDATRYGGAGFGNLSRRLPGRPDAFVITGTQTGGMPALGCFDFAVVTAVDVAANSVVSHGGRPPSSECMTHSAMYAVDPAVNFVFHGHAPVLWSRRAQLELPCTPEAVQYGTPAMARAFSELHGAGMALPSLIAMGGHEDGIIAFGADADSVGELWLSALLVLV